MKNGIAYLRGLLWHLISYMKPNIDVGFKTRIFATAELDLSRGALLKISHGVKLRERAFISVRQGAKLIMDQNTSIGRDCKIVCHNSITIGEGTLLSPGVMIYDHDHKFDASNGVHRKEFNVKPISIGKNCWIGANVVILKGTTIGDRCVVGAGTVLKGEFSDDFLITQKRTTDIRVIERDKNNE